MEKQKVTVLINPTIYLRKYVIHMMVIMQFEVSKYSKIFDAISAHNRGYTQILIRTKQVGFSRDGDNSRLVDNEVRNVPSMNIIYVYIRLQ